MGSCSSCTQSDQDKEIKEVLGKIKHKLLVMSGKGGVGKSTVAANTAIALSKQGYKVGLLDVDFHGPSIAQILGTTGLPLNAMGKFIQPYIINQNLKVMTIQGMLQNPDEAIVWRGPMKIGVIKQFLVEVEWGQLDYLIIDSPPGTGDEPLTVAQTIPDCKAIVVTTPQDVALADVRKSLTFCKELNMEVIGIVENMSGFKCPDCGKIHDIFKSGGGRLLAEKNNIPFLGKLPIEPAVVEAGDSGAAVYDTFEISTELDTIVKEINNNLKASEQRTASMPAKRIAIPLAEGKLCNHFGHCEEFIIYDIENKEVKKSEKLTPPPHEPGVIPNWLAEQKVTLVLAGGMGPKAQEILKDKGVIAFCGVVSDTPDNIIADYLAGTLKVTHNACDHKEGEEHHCHH